MIFAADDISGQARSLPRDWGRLIQKLRWIGLDDEADRLEWAVSEFPVEQRCKSTLDPVDTD